MRTSPFDLMKNSTRNGPADRSKMGKKCLNCGLTAYVMKKKTPLHEITTFCLSVPCCLSWLRESGSGYL
jgi:hypothetical protein